MGEQGMGDAALRATNSLFGAAGRWDLRLRVPAPAAIGDDAEQLGLATPQFTDVAMGPAVFRKADSDTVLLVAGSAAAQIAGTADADAIDAMFLNAAGVVDGSALYEIESVEARWAADTVYCYALTLLSPVH